MGYARKKTVDTHNNMSDYIRVMEHAIIVTEDILPLLPKTEKWNEGDELIVE